MAKAQTQAPNLSEQLALKRAELVETKRSHAANELVNPRALGRIRKEIARIQTQMNVPAVSATEHNETTAEETK